MKFYFLNKLYIKIKNKFIKKNNVVNLCLNRYKRKYKRVDTKNTIIRTYRKKIISKIFLLGPKESYSYIVGSNYIKNYYKNSIIKLCSTFKEIIKKTENEKESFAILPIENTNSGSIYEVYDLLINSKLYILKEFNMKINHCLLSKKRTNINKIKFLYSHYQPFKQCNEFIKKFKKVKIVNTNSTSEAMKTISKIKSPIVAAIGSLSGSKFYDLLVVKKNINNKNNITKFILLSNTYNKNEVDNARILIFMINFKSKKYRVINIIFIINKYKIKIDKLENRIFYNNKSQEVLYVNIKNNFNFTILKKMLDEIKKESNYIRFMGYFI
ncbi:prephenate dehydratase domain-containing protein [Candidatus Annandia pinicola]|uniref:prephenate dehydratase domain-containing protein n=1 Tax=Candidatus Annandia pinicola TaxID=1345117 RepID=UPI001D016FA5|nr:prephenate dehydratase domain-containing protein [Candidatus Annandia pinicola]UDG80433.1 P-protein [Candidatus Annandia pinicola]